MSDDLVYIVEDSIAMPPRSQKGIAIRYFDYKMKTKNLIIVEEKDHLNRTRKEGEGVLTSNLSSTSPQHSLKVSTSITLSHSLDVADIAFSQPKSTWFVLIVFNIPLSISLKFRLNTLSFF